MEDGEFRSEREEVGRDITPERREEFEGELKKNLATFLEENPDWQGMGFFGVGGEYTKPEDGQKGHQSRMHACCSAEALSYLIRGMCEAGDEMVDAVFIGLMATESRRQHILARLMMTVSHPAMMMQLMSMNMAAMAGEEEKKKEEEDEIQFHTGGDAKTTINEDQPAEPTHTMEDLMNLFKKDGDDGKG